MRRGAPIVTLAVTGMLILPLGLTSSAASDSSPRTVQASQIEVLFDGTPESFERWRHVGAGSFELRDDGTMRTVGGLGMLWYPVRQYSDFALRFEWRDLSPDGAGNGGVFVRFPDPEESAAAPATEQHLCQAGIGQAGPAWVAIACGHEIQINDWQDSDAQKTGSVYNFAPNDAAAARRTAKETWNSYEIRVSGAGDYSVTVSRGGQVIQEWQNSPGQFSSRPTDPPTDLRQFPIGFVGLQNHGDVDVIEYRNVSIEDLSAPAAQPAPDPSNPPDPSPEPTLPSTGGALAGIGLVGLLAGVSGRRRGESPSGRGI